MTASPRHAWTLACALTLLGSPARAQEACWAPDRSQPPDRAVARTAPVAALNADIARVSEILKQNAAFTRIPNVRLMVTSYIGYANQGFGHSVRISGGLYPPNTWREQCTLMAGPEFFNNGHVHVTFNGPGEIFSNIPPVLKDDVLTAYVEPTGASPAGAETYYESIAGVVLTPGRVPPWVAVTATEHLAYRERAAQKRIDDLKGELAKLEASVERYRGEMAQQISQTRDAAEKARLQKALDENAATLRAASAEGIAEFGRLLREAEAALTIVRDDRARMSPAQLAAQARADRGPLVKVNPALGGGSRRVNLIVVHAAPNARAMAAPLKQAVREMDYAALRALME